jgi:hypothetical protein
VVQAFLTALCYIGIVAIATWVFVRLVAAQFPAVVTTIVYAVAGIISIVILLTMVVPHINA